MTKNQTILNFVLIFYWFGVLLYDFIDKNLGFSFVDEILTLVLFLLYLQFKLFKSLTISRSFFLLLAIFIFYFFYSLMIQSNSFTAIVSDMTVLLKPFIAYFTIIEMKPSFDPSMLKTLRYNAIAGAVVLPFLFLLDLHAARFATAASITAILFLYSSRFTLQNVLYFIFILSIGLLSTRSKMYGFFVLSSFLALYFLSFKNQPFYLSRKNFLYVSLVIVLIFIAAFDKIYFYFYSGVFESKNMFARPLLFLTSFQIACDYFPFGSGFASFGSYFSGIYYSDIYYKYDLYWQQGFDPEAPKFIADTFFPELLGQFGFIVFGLFIYAGWRILKNTYTLQKIYDKSIKDFLIVVLIINFFIIESIADSTFTHNRGVFMMLLLALTLKSMRSKHEYPTNQ